MIPVAMTPPLGVFIDEHYGPIPIVEVIWKYYPVVPQPLHPQMHHLPPMPPPQFRVPVLPGPPLPPPFPWPPMPPAPPAPPVPPDVQMPNAAMGYDPNGSGNFAGPSY